MNSTLNMETTFEKEKRLKSSLIQTRNTIANKFRKLHRNQMMREKKLQNEYAPITDSIKKLIETKENVSSEKSRLHKNEDESNIKTELNEDIEDEFDLMTFETPSKWDSKSGLSDSKSNVRSSNVRNADRQHFFEAHDVVTRDDVYSLENRKEAKRVNAIANRKKHRSKLSDDLRQYKEEEAVNTRNMNSIREVEQMNEDNSNDKYEIEDYVIPSKVKPSRKTSEKVVISPEDFDEDGYYVGLATKRRAIEVKKKELKLVRPRTTRQKKRDKDSLKLVHSGKCLQRKFIPYNENIVYEYYGNPNELCERLKLLIASKSVGNTNHDQEINSIIEELRENHVIDLKKKIYSKCCILTI